MAQQNEIQVRQEVKNALRAAWNALKQCVDKKDQAGQVFCYKIGQAFNRVETLPLKKLNGLLVEINEHLFLYGRQKIGSAVFDAVDKAIESTGAATFFDDNVAGEKTKTP
jgi:hypothetical protein